mgnify:CR=1 FL=1
MLKFSQWLVKHKAIVLVLGVLLIIPCAIGFINTRVNYDILSYLPKDIDTMKGQDILKEEFGQGGFSFVMVDGMTDKEVAETADKLDFGYRHSMFENGGYTILSCKLKLKKGNYDEIKALMADYNKRRSDKQPLSQPSAGSTFKRPEGYFAGKLIQDAGLMGYSVGGAMVSDKHAGFVVNKGGATAKDVLDLIKYVQDTVEEKFGVKLEPEVRLIGEQ